MQDIYHTQPQASDILIIGGGVIGICTAYYLARAGRPATLLEAGDVCSGASHGNAGFVLYSHIMPLAAPGVLGQGLRWLLDPTSPFYVKPRFSRELASWLWRFGSACNEKRTWRSMAVLSELSRISQTLFQELTVSGRLSTLYQKRGHLKLYRTDKGLDKGRQEAEWVAAFGVEGRTLSPDEIHELEPRVSGGIAGGIYFPGDAHLVPDGFVRELANLARTLGTDIHTGTEVLGLEARGSKITRVVTTRGVYQPNQVVLAGGAWSPAILRDLQLHLPIQAAKGYSVTYRCLGNPLSIPLLLKEAAVAVTPMDRKIRFAGTLELAGPDLSVNLRRINAFLERIGEYLSDLADLELLEIWRGLRPCTPDGLPVIGRLQRYTNLILATGHAMVGMALGPATGMLVSQIAEGVEPEMDLTPLCLERFA